MVKERDTLGDGALIDEEDGRIRGIGSAGVA
jgi:hypothetical protein